MEYGQKECDACTDLITESECYDSGMESGQVADGTHSPLRNHQVLQGEQRHVTRFIALAQFGNPDKKHRVSAVWHVSPTPPL